MHVRMYVIALDVLVSVCVRYLATVHIVQYVCTVCGTVQIHNGTVYVHRPTAYILSMVEQTVCMKILKLSLSLSFYSGIFTHILR